MWESWVRVPVSLPLLTFKQVVGGSSPPEHTISFQTRIFLVCSLTIQYGDLAQRQSGRLCPVSVSLEEEMLVIPFPEKVKNYPTSHDFRKRIGSNPIISTNFNPMDCESNLGITSKVVDCPVIPLRRRTGELLGWSHRQAS